jgi:aspartate/methionine/tyrosine aminotransferase
MQIKPFQLERFFEKYEFNTKYMLCGSDCESFSIKEIIDEDSLQNFLDLRLGYTETKGNPELRNEIVKLYSTISDEQILVHTGAEEAIFNFFLSSFNNDDEIIVHYPCYQSLYEIAESSGCNVIKWFTNEKENWELDLEFLRKSITKKTKAVVINIPHNPTGYLPSKELFFEIIEICRENNLLLFCDEVYRFLEYKTKDRLPAACDVYENAISLGVMSKSFGLPGLRLGWIATKNQNIYNRLAAIKDYTTICNPAPSEFIATHALKKKDEILSRNLEIILSNLSLLDLFFYDHENIFNWQKPKAGPIAFPSLLKESSDYFCTKLLESKNVLLLPSTYYNFGNKNFRIGFGRKTLKEGLEKIEEFLK